MSEVTERSARNVEQPAEVRRERDAIPEVSVVIPVYNEGKEVIDRCYAEVSRVLNEYGKSWEIIFIDDFSQDGSLSFVLAHAKQDHRITVVEHLRNMGAVKAILSGLKQSRGKVVVPFDPDLQFAPESIPTMVDQVFAGYDFCGGIRVNRHDGPLKKLSSALGSAIINQIMGIRQKDFGSIKAYSRKVVDAILSLPQDYIAVQAAAFSISRNFTEVPIRHSAREVGESKWTFLMRLDYFLDVYSSYARHPFALVLIVGFFVTILSLCGAVATIIYWLARELPVNMSFYLFLGIWLLTLMFGLHFMALGLVAQFSARAFRRKFQIDDQGNKRVHRPAAQPSQSDRLS